MDIDLSTIKVGMVAIEQKLTPQKAKQLRNGLRADSARNPTHSTTKYVNANILPLYSYEQQQKQRSLTYLANSEIPLLNM